MELVIDVGGLTLAGVKNLLNEIQRAFDGTEKQCTALEIQRGRLEERVMKLKAFSEAQHVPAKKPFRDRDAWLKWAFERCAIGEFQQMEGILLGRQEQRSYTVCTGGQIFVFSGQSIAEAQGKVRKFLKSLKQQPPPVAKMMRAEVG